MGCESFTEGFGPLMEGWDTRIALDDIAALERELVEARCRGVRHRAGAGQRRANPRRRISSSERRSFAGSTARCSICDEVQTGLGRTGKMVGLRALGSRAGHHHAREDAERRLRAVRRDRHAARDLPEDLQPPGPLRGAFVHLWPQQPRDGLRPGRAGSDRRREARRERRARWARC